MSAKYWKLTIAPLSPGSASAREVVVEGENWLSALRAARKALGEDGAVPKGASCVMSASGEVTILDSAQRLRYLLARSEPPPPAEPEHAPAAAPAAAERAPASLPPPAIKVAAKRSTTIAYSPEESAAVRAQLNAAQAPAAAVTNRAAAPEPTKREPAVAATEPASTSSAPPAATPAGGAPETRPVFSPARPTSRPPPEKSEPPKADPRRPIPAKRSATVTYSPEESAQLRRAALETTQGASKAATKSETTPTAQLRISTPAPAPNGESASAAALPKAALPSPAAQPAPSSSNATRPARKQTIAYSPEESAQARALLHAAQATTASTTTSHASSAQDDLVEAEAASMLVTLGHRDEETSPDSPLTYRERSYYWQPPAARDEVERALRGELSHLRKTLRNRARGQYVNLAVFDHAFGDKPERPPVATLQWKDWRGEPVFAWLEDGTTTDWSAAQSGQPVKSSYFPDANTSVPAAPPAASAPLPKPAAEPKAAGTSTPAAVTNLSSTAAPSSAGPVQAAAGHASIGSANTDLPPPPPLESSVEPAASADLAGDGERKGADPGAGAGSSVAVPALANDPALAPPGLAPMRRESTGEQDLRLAVAFEAVQDLYFLATPADGLDFAVKLLAELVPAEAISGCIYDINTDEFRFVALTGAGASERRAEAVRSSQGLFGVAAHARRDNLIVPDVMSEPRFDPSIDGRTGLVARNMAFFVLHKADQLFGMLQLINRDRGQTFREADIAVASYIANQMTAFLREKRGLG